MIKTDCCARCYYLRYNRYNKVNSRGHFFCLNKGRDITHDDISNCKSFVCQRHINPKLEEQYEKDLELLFNIESNKENK